MERIYSPEEIYLFHFRSRGHNVTMNNSTHTTEASCRHAVSIFFTTTMAIIGTAAVIGNTLVIIMVCKTPSLRTCTNYYYVNVAVSDFLSSLATVPLYLSHEIITSSGSLLKGSLATYGCKVGVYIRMVSAITSILSLVLVAVDRFIGIVFPLNATLITRNIRTVLVISTWLISMAYCIPMYLYFKVEEGDQETSCKFAWNGFALIIYYTPGLVFFEFLPLIAIIVLYSRIMGALRQRLRVNSGCNLRSTNTQQSRNRQNQNIMKIFKSIVIMLFSYMSLFLFYLVLRITYPDLFAKDRCKWILGFTYFVFPLLSTATNPVILFSFSSNFRRALKKDCSFLFGKVAPCFKTGATVRHRTNVFDNAFDNVTLPELVTFQKTPW